MRRQNLDLAWTYLEQLQVPRDDAYGPVLLGRELLIRAHEFVDLENGHTNASMLLNAAITTFLWGVIDPSPTEYPIDGVEFGRLDALMWFGICTSVFVPHDTVFSSDDLPSRPPFMNGVSDPMVLEIASFGFESIGDFTKAGRCAEELGEIIKLDQSSVAAQIYFDRAVQMFNRASDAERADVALKRSKSTSRTASPFFRRAPGSITSSTIAGSQEFSHLRSMLRLG